MASKIGLLIDLGNSGTRVFLVDKEQNFTTYYFELANKYAIRMSEIPKEYINNKSYFFEVNGEKYTQGYIVAREFRSRVHKPNAITAKTKQLTTHLSLNLVFIHALRMLSSYRKVPISALDLEFEVTALLPPSEHSTNLQALTDIIMGIKTVKCDAPETFNKDIVITSVSVLPESAAAFLAASFKVNSNGTIEVREKNLPYQSGDILVIDIGAGTTDFVNIKDSELVVSSKQTYPRGGNNIEASCKKCYYETFGYYPDDTDVLNSLQTGYLIQGGVERDVLAIVNKVKRTFSIELSNFLFTYLESNALDVHAIKGILLVGGGILPTIRDNKIISDEVSKTLSEYVTGVSSTIHLIDLEGQDPRRMNIEGLRVYYADICKEQ